MLDIESVEFLDERVPNVRVPPLSRPRRQRWQRIRPLKLRTRRGLRRVNALDHLPGGGAELIVDADAGTEIDEGRNVGLHLVGRLVEVGDRMTACNGAVGVADCADAS